MTEWNATLYDRQHDFVAEYGKGLLEFVPHQDDQSILDLGCGTGTLTAQLANRGRIVRGTDNSATMIEQARASFPELDFAVQDALTMTDQNEWQVIFSNAVFHWIPDHETLLHNIERALTPGGTLICEFGAAGNIATIEHGFEVAFDHDGGHYQPKFNFAAVDVFTRKAQEAGLVVDRCYDFDRPTPLKAGEQGLANWAKQFFASELATLSAAAQQTVLDELDSQVQSQLWNGEQWVADYRRIRCVAHKIIN